MLILAKVYKSGSTISISPQQNKQHAEFPLKDLPHTATGHLVFDKNCLGQTLDYQNTFF